MRLQPPGGGVLPPHVGVEHVEHRLPLGRIRAGGDHGGEADRRRVDAGVVGGAEGLQVGDEVGGVGGAEVVAGHQRIEGPARGVDAPPQRLRQRGGGVRRAHARVVDPGADRLRLDLLVQRPEEIGAGDLVRTEEGGAGDRRGVAAAFALAEAAPSVTAGAGGRGAGEDDVADRPAP